ncbi:hypothetical protein D3C73_537000 [compost metagenome]
MHREEADIKADKHQPEGHLAPGIGKLLSCHEGEIIVDAGDDREEHAADDHVVQMRNNEIRIMRLPIERHERHHHAGQATDGEDRQTACPEQHWHGKDHAARQHGGDEDENLHPRRDRHGLRRSRKEGERYLRQAGGEHVMHPQAEAEETCTDRRKHDPGISYNRPLRECRHDHCHQRDGRQEDDVDFRVTENPEQVLP